MTMTLRAVVEIVMTGLLVLSFAAIVIAIGRMLRRPAVCTCSSELFTVVSVYGDACGLEHTVQSLLIGKGCGRILIVDCGLSAEPRRLAELLAEGSGLIELCLPDDLPHILEGKHGLRVSDS